jgi:glycosyltransferase involved in cell wall biosynthesis
MNVVVLQPSVPSYRLGLFSRLAERLGSGFTVHASVQDLGVLTERAVRQAWERPLGPIRTILPGLLWQHGAMSISVRRGDVVIVSGAPRCLSNIAFLIKARLKGARTIWWGHYWSSTSRPWRAGLRMLLMQLSDAILFYTDREVEEYSAGRHASRKPVLGLNNGIETDEIIRLREPYDPSLRPRDLLFIGRITPKAELGLLLEALALSACAGIRLDVIGSGEDDAHLRERCVELGIAERVTWHGGTKDERRIAEIANACKAFVYPGGVGLSLIHGLAYGLPAIIHDARRNHMPEFAALEAGRNGITFKQGDTASLAEAIALLQADSERLKGMSAAAISTITHSFNAADMADRFCVATEAAARCQNLPAHALR